MNAPGTSSPSAKSCLKGVDRRDVHRSFSGVTRGRVPELHPWLYADISYSAAPISRDTDNREVDDQIQTVVSENPDALDDVPDRGYGSGPRRSPRQLLVRG